MEKLRERLQAAGVWDEKVENDVAALWKYGVNAICDAELRGAIAGFLCVVPTTFYFDPASRTG